MTVKKALVLTALSASVFACFPLHAEPVTVVNPPAAVKPVDKSIAPAAKAPSELLQAITALGNEINSAMGSGKGNPIPKLDKLVAFDYSADTKAKLAKVFGNVQPLAITRGTIQGGKNIIYTLAAPAHSYTDAAATTTAWTALEATLMVDKAGRTMTSTGGWDALTISDKDAVMSFKGMSLTGSQQRNARNLWLGSMTGKVDTVSITTEKGPAVVMDDMTIAATSSARGAGVDLAYDFKIRTVKAAGEQIDDIRYLMRMTNVDLVALEKMSAAFTKADGPAMSVEQETALLMSFFKTFGKNIAARGTALEIDDFSAAYRGHRATIKGSISLAKSTDADFKSLAAVGKKVVARLHVRVPVALVTEMSKMFMARQAEQKGEKMTPEENANIAQTMTDVLVGKMLNGGLAKLDNGVLLSLIEFKDGKLTFNGKEVEIPKPKAVPPSSEQSANDADPEPEVPVVPVVPVVPPAD